MSEKKPEKMKADAKSRDDVVDLENQFILRIPEEAAKTLHEAIQSGNLRDRLSIKMDNDLRYGEVRFDNWFFYAKILDLPTIIECLKTIDNKSFYKSADICQIMICKEDPDTPEAEKDLSNKNKKNDPNKVDKKFLWPHGITPPCKNVRKRRFRNTLKKKNVEAQEIEEEVRHLLRIDNDAVNVRYEIINEDVDESAIGSQLGKNERDIGDRTFMKNRKQLNDSNSNKGDINVESDGDDEFGGVSLPIGDVGEHDIFGEEVSSSDDDEDGHRPSQIRELEDMSRLSADDSHISDFSVGGGPGEEKPKVTEFSKSMFARSRNRSDDGDDGPRDGFHGPNSNVGPDATYYERKRNEGEGDYSNDGGPQLTNEEISAKIRAIRKLQEHLKTQHAQRAQKIACIQNPTLKQRMQETLDNLISQMFEKEMEIKKYKNMLYG